MILDDFECNLFVLFMINALENLPKWTLAQRTQYFVSICDRVSNRYFHVALMVSKIFDRLNSSKACVVDFIFLNFFLLKFSHVWKSALLISGRSVFVNVNVTVSDLSFNAAKFVFLKVWRRLILFYQTWMLSLHPGWPCTDFFRVNSVRQFLQFLR